MKHRYHLWLVGALVLSSASITQAHLWKGKTGNKLYNSLGECFAQNNDPCTWVGRVVQVGSLADLPDTTAATGARVARKDAGTAVLYYTRATASAGPDILGKNTSGCLNRDGSFSKGPPCGKKQIEVIVMEP